MTTKASPFPTAVNPYGYKLPIEYSVSDPGLNSFFIKIVFKTAMQVSRIEVVSGK